MQHMIKSLTRFVGFLRPRPAQRMRLTLFLTFAIAASVMSIYGLIVSANNTAQTLPFSQDWTNTGLITANDDWSGVQGIEGFLGDRAASGTTTDIDPQTVLDPLTTIDVVANQTNPNTNTAGGVAEFQATLQSTSQQTIALQGSGTADHPNIVLYLNTTGQTGISVSYNLRDIDCSVDNAQQQVALQYRVGASGNFTNIPAGYVADATARVNAAAADVANCTLVTPVSVALPAAAENQPLVQVRIITSNATGSDEWVGVDDIVVSTGPVMDVAPSVLSTNPADNATGIPLAANVSVTFSEDVTAPASAFSISCAMSGAHTFALSGGPTTFTLNPDTDFVQNEVCTVTVTAAQVADVDANDPPDNMAADFIFDFTTADLGSCGGAFTPIFTIQGSGTASPSAGASATIEGVVVGDFQGASSLKGFYVQDATGDANPATSDGIFIFDGDTPAVNVAVGDRVRITGTVSEQFNNTQINPASSIIICSSGNTLPAPTAVDLPEPVNNDLERYENMLVNFPETLTVTGNFGLGRFGEVVLSSDGRLFQQNNFNRTNSVGALAVAESNPRRYVLLDDGLSIQNPDPTPYFDGNNTRRVGDTIAGLQGVLTFDFSEYRVQPTAPVVFTSANPRTATPATVGGNVKASSFNVLNYFNGNGAGGGFPTSRGASSLAEFNRQRDKIIAAILAINADVYGVIEIENDGNNATSAIQDLINGLNAATAAGTYAFREGTTPGTDLIKNSIIYKTTTVTPDGVAVNDTDAIWEGQARNPLAQTFTLNSNGEKFVFIVNHFTSKGCSANDTGLDADQGDGQGCDNLQRTLQAEALLDFIEERQTASGEARVLVMGDLNAYGEEDPIFRLEDDASDRLMDGPGGLIDLVQKFVPVASRYSYQFDEYSGYLDHALASKELDPFVSGTTIWHINADEPTILDYNLEFKSAAQQAINVGTPYRASDHDPVIVGLTLGVICPTIVVTPSTVPAGTAGTAYGPVQFMQAGGGGAITWSVSSNNLPAGLTLNPMTGQLSGTPTVAAGVNVTIRATDINNCFGEVIVTLQINCPTITIAPSSGSPTVLTGGTVGQAYSQTFTAAPAGGGYTYSIPAPSIPAGLMFNPSTGVLSGTPTTTGTFGFTVTATGFGSCTGQQNYSLTIGCQTITITPAGPALPNGTIGLAYSQQLTANNGSGTVNFTLQSGTLPAGITMSLAGLISGMPTATGMSSFTVLATDANNCTATQAYTLTIGCQSITVSPAGPALPPGMSGTLYSQTFTQTGGNGATNFAVSAGTLPMGLTLAPGGLLSGTPTEFGNFSFTVRATDANNCFGETAYTLVINPPCGAINITPATLPNGFVGTAYNATLDATGGTASYNFTVSAGTLPAGLTLSTAGALSGTPTATGTFTFTVKATDANNCMGTQAYTVIISGNGLQFYPLASPVRLLDTRTGFNGCTTGTGALTAGETRTQPARTMCSMIPANATAVIGNITVVPSAPGFLTLFPSDATQPTVANSNFKAGEVTNNFFTVGLGVDGAFKIYASAATDVIIDLTGYYAPPGAGGLFYHPLPSPVRLVETRAGQTGCFQPSQLMGTNNPNADPNLDLPVQGRGPGLPSPCNSIPSDAAVLVGNATTVFPNAPLGYGYLTIYPSGATRPTVASSNYANNDVINGPFAVKLGADGQFKIYTFSTTDLVVDITGYYSASPTDANGAGLLFSPLPTPMRLLETRPDFPSLPLVGCYRPNAPIAGQPNIRTQPVWGMCSDQPITIPDTARAIVGNATVINPVAAGFLTFYPGDAISTPTAATSNYPFPVTFGYNRHYYVGLSPVDGTFKILTQFTTDLIVDVSGYFAP